MKYEAKYDKTGDGIGDIAANHNCEAGTGMISTNYGWGWWLLGDDVFNTPGGTACNTGGPVVSSAQGSPIVNIRLEEARTACPYGSHLITNDEWMTIARNVEQVPENWADNTIGSTIASGGGLKRGNLWANDSATYQGLIPEQGAGRNQKAKLVLFNSEEIWDLSGNVKEWVDNTIACTTECGDKNCCTRDEMPHITAPGSAWWSAEFTNIDSYGSLSYKDIRPANDTYNHSHGVGGISFPIPCDEITNWDMGLQTGCISYAFERGGDGVFALDLRNQGGVYKDGTINYLHFGWSNGIGFRCVMD
jgi:hypothetical protein